MNEYKKDVRRCYNPLTKKAQKDLYTKMKHGDLMARDKLISSCLPLVVDIAKKFSINNKHVELEDLVQEGNMALIRAVDNWDISKSYLTTLTTHYVKRSLINMIYDSNYHIKTSRQLTRSASRQLYKIKKTNLTDPVEIAIQTGIPEKTVIKLLSFAKENRHRRVGRGMGVRDGSRSRRLIENVPAPSDDNRQREVCLQDLIEVAKVSLTPKEQSLIRYWYGIDKPKLTLKKLSEKVNDNMRSVRKSIRAAERKLKQAVLEA
jgi:RNA polymerase sigma factor (sigma-70 family)